MGTVDNLADPNQEIRRLWSAIRKLQTRTPLASASVERGRLRFYAGSELLIEDGNFSVTGTASVTGELTGAGTFEWTGPVLLKGATDITGAVTLDSTLTFAGGASIAGDSVQVTAESLIILDAPQVLLTGLITAVDAKFSGSLKNTGITGTTNSGNVYIDPTTKQFYQITSARRFKIRPRKMKLPPGLLDVPIKEWIDKGARERGEPDAYIPGVIAEEVAEAGGDQFVTHDERGDIAGVAYDRLALARTQLLSVKLDAALKKIEALEKALATQG